MIYHHFPNWIVLLTLGFGFGLLVGCVMAAWWCGVMRDELNRYEPGVDGIDNVIPLRSISK